jgi:hypothetical protein
MRNPDLDQPPWAGKSPLLPPNSDDGHDSIPRSDKWYNVLWVNRDLEELNGAANAIN